MNRATFLKRAGLGAALVAGAGGRRRHRLPAGERGPHALAGRARPPDPGPPHHPRQRGVQPARARWSTRASRARGRWPSCARAARRTCARPCCGAPATTCASRRARAATATPATRRSTAAWWWTSPRLDGIRVSADRRTVQVGAGNHLIDVYTALANRGLTIPAGSCPTVGVGGLALGGGVGLASRALGTTSDNIVGADRRDGRRRGARPATRAPTPTSTGPAAAAAGGNFGIATGFTFTTHRVSSASYFFANFAWSDAADVIAAWQRWAPNAPAELFSICSLGTGVSGGPILNVFGQYMGSAAALRRTLARGLTSAVTPAQHPGGHRPLPLAHAALGGVPGRVGRGVPHPPARAVRRQVALRPQADPARRDPRDDRDDGAAPAPVLARVGRDRDGLLRWGDQRGRARTRRPSCIATRCSRCSTAPTGRPPAGASAGLSWIRGAVRTTQPYVSGYSYQNYIDPELTDLAEGLLRHQPGAADRREVDRRPGRPVPLPPEHPGAVTDQAGTPAAAGAPGAIGATSGPAPRAAGAGSAARPARRTPRSSAS